ncbi:hypothetical protein L1987_47242 [Smallanthus sonchifolius]|uniref:Uncharacterized protein n=1 Tax=Smallanthus sonchifolius TaxID=185202 RepID=A0ACB9G204_9ASTR|nr:hypothetical protein L1987_47242 [Smallanthus sonchifolius]
MGDEAGRCNLLIELQHQFAPQNPPAFSVQTVGRVADNSQMEYEAKSLGWYLYDVSTFLLHKSLEMEFGLEEDEWVNMRNNVSVRLPDVRGREEILEVHSKNKKLDRNVSLSVIVM